MSLKPNKSLDRHSLWKKYSHWLYTLVLPVYLILFFWQESVLDGSAPYLVSYLPMDDAIPFCEWFYIAYVLWYPFMGLTGLYLAFTDPPGYRRYMTYIGVSFFTALLLFALFPNGQDLRPDLSTLGRENLFTRAIAALYQADTNTNVCPSLHVVGSMAAVFGVFHNTRLRRTVWAPILAVVLALFIIASTVFIKQHSILDAFVGVPYGMLTYAAVYHLPSLWRNRRRKSSPVTTENG